MKASTPLRGLLALEPGTRGALLLVAFVLAPAPALAQAPWTVTITPTMNPLPVGFCAAVQVSVRDAAGLEIPRNPQGQRVTLADFDMTVVSPGVTSAVGKQVDASHWSVCGCQGATAGTTATITASYPARLLSASARVPGVDVKASARFELAAAKGDINAPGCPSSAMRAELAAAVARTVQPARVAVAVPPVSPPVTVTLTPTPAPPVVVGEARTLGAGATRVAPYEPSPVTISFDVNAKGSWYEPGPLTVNFAVSAHGSWYEPGPVTVIFNVTAAGSWNEITKSPAGPLKPAPTRP